MPTKKEREILRRFLPHAFDPDSRHIGLKQYSDEYLRSYATDLKKTIEETVAEARYYGAEPTYDKAELMARLHHWRQLIGRLNAVRRAARKRGLDLG